jgi:hypothetical protein
MADPANAVPNGMSPTEMAQAILGKAAPAPDSPDVVEASPDAPESTSAGVSTNQDFAARAAAAEAELAQEFGMEVPEQPAPETTTEPEQTTAPADPIEQLLNTKYGGDKEKMVNGLHETWRSGAELAKINKELQAKLDAIEQKLGMAGTTTPASTPATPEPVVAPEIQENIKWFDQEIASLAKESETAATRQNELVTLGRTLQTSLLREEGKLEIADDLDKAGIEARINQIKAEINAHAQEWRSLENRKRESEYNTRKYKLDKRDAESRLAYAKEQEAEKQRLVGVQQETILRQFFVDFAEGAAEAGIPEDQDVRNHLVNIVRAEAAYVLSNMAPGQPFDLKAFTKARVAAHAKVFGFAGRAEFKQVSREKLAGQTKSAPKGSSLPRPLPPVPQGPWSADFAKKRAAKILG